MDDLELNLEKGSISLRQALYVTIKTLIVRFSGDTQINNQIIGVIM